MNSIDELLPGKSRNPGLVGSAASTNFGNDNEIVGVGVQRLSDQLVGNMRTIEIAGVDVIYSSSHSFPQYG